MASVKQYTIEDVKELARQREGICLATEYINSTAKMLFECKHGHQFESCREYLIDGNWCPFCAGRRKIIQDLQKLAHDRGGLCLSEAYLGMSVKHLWQCSEGHTWEAIPQNIQTLNRWCPECGKLKSAEKRRQYTIEDMQELARSREGLCLSPRFESVIKKLIWQCSEGHQWEADPHHIKSGGWCPECANKTRGESRRKRYDIERLHKIAASKGGRLLSTAFDHVKAHLEWECDKGHRWKANADNVVNSGKWCPDCAGKNQTIQDMQQIALERGGKCLSLEYGTTNSKLLWECADGHQWEAVPSSIKSGTWCPECKAGLGERICRAFFEQLLDTPFPKTRPNWLRTTNGHQMELDGYSELLGVAFEHQGSQHFKPIRYFSKSKKELNIIQENDQRKRHLCSQNNVTLIEIPSVLEMLGVDSLKGFIQAELLKSDTALPDNFDSTQVNLTKTYAPQILEELKLIAIDRGGRLLSQEYLGIFECLEWECAKGHQWKAAPNNVKNSGSWCSKCAGMQKRTIEEMQAVASSRGGKCLSEVYVNGRTSLLWECAKGHQWNARPGNVAFGTWCPECAKKARAEKRKSSCLPAKKTVYI